MSLPVCGERDLPAPPGLDIDCPASEEDIIMFAALIGTKPAQLREFWRLDSSRLCRAADLVAIRILRLWEREGRQHGDDSPPVRSEDDPPEAVAQAATLAIAAGFSPAVGQFPGRSASPWEGEGLSREEWAALCLIRLWKERQDALSLAQEELRTEKARRRIELDTMLEEEDLVADFWRWVGEEGNTAN